MSKKFVLSPMQRDRQLVLITHTLSHFAVDFVCYYFLLNTAWTLPYVSVALIYCMLAFACQLLIGLLADQKPAWPLLPVGLSMILFAFFPHGLLRLIMMATGNAFFHTYAGRTLLLRYTYTENGWFNGAGGFGLVLGTFLGLHHVSAVLPLLVIAVFTTLEWVLYVGLRRDVLRLPLAPPPATPEHFKPRVTGIGMWVLGLALLFIAASTSEWAVQLASPDQAGKTVSYLFVGVTIWICKTLGSWLFERLYSPAALLGLTVFIFVLSFWAGTPILNWLIFALLLLLNLYPLYGLKKLLPEHVGLAFGLNKLGLALAFLLLFLPRTALVFKLVLVILMVLALIGALTLKPKGGTL